MSDGELVLVGDIGGTNARFALKTADGNTVRFATSEVAEHPTFTGALAAFLDEAGARPSRACIAVAGPVTAGRASFTNSPWTIDAEALERACGFDDVAVINDFAALGHFALSRRPEDVTCVKRGHSLRHAPVLVIGPGTGLGQSIAVPAAAGCPITIATEGGHGVLPATTRQEAAILAVVSDDLGRPPSNEDIVSGIGLVRLHAARMRLEDKKLPERTTPADITDGALAGEPDALATAEQFFLFLATVASNAALATGARGGVLLAGGILPRVQRLFLDSGFAARFVGKGMMTQYLDGIPVDLVSIDDAALRGAHSVLADNVSDAGG